MARIEILGPKDQLTPVLETLRDEGLVHLEPAVPSCPPADLPFASQLATLEDSRQLNERLFLQDLLFQVEELLELLPGEPGRESYLSPERALTALKVLIPAHLKQLHDSNTESERLRQALSDLLRQQHFLDALVPLIDQFPQLPDLELIGIELERTADLEKLHQLLQRKLHGQYALHLADLPGEKRIVLVALPHNLTDALRTALREGHIPEYGNGGQAELSLPQKRANLEQQIRHHKQALAALDGERATFTKRWKPLYLTVQTWLRNRISLSLTAAAIACTEMCFVIAGWLPRERLEHLRTVLQERFGPAIVIEEKELTDEDLDRIPVTLKNPMAFRPYELFTRLLPLPRYYSLDPTPFIAIFFPIFFGMILGDLGYGLLLGAIGLLVRLTVARKRALLRDGSVILLTCAFYTGIFGILYGEFFGEQGAHLLGLQPVIFDRMHALAPMALFALAAGVLHVLLGLILGAGSAFRHRHLREGMVKMLGVLFITAVALSLLSYLAPAAQAVRRPALLVLALAFPVMILLGGLLAPLEMLKSLGHIISYIRIMAVGMTSVMLAYVANELGGATGSIVAGIVIAAMLHLFNLALGIFAPSVHALRLHFVEFFSKFFEGGGPRYTPLKKE